MNFLIRSFGLACVINLVGCATPSTQFQDNSGRTFSCEASGFGVLGTSMALLSHQECVNKMQAAGYRSVSKETVTVKASTETSHLGINLPIDWVRESLNENQVKGGFFTRAVNKNTDSGIMANAASRDGVNDLMAYASSRRAALQSFYSEAQGTEIKKIDLEGKVAFRFEVSGVAKSGVRITHTATIIDAKNQIVMINAWTTSANFDSQRDNLEKIATLITGI